MENKPETQKTETEAEATVRVTAKPKRTAFYTAVMFLYRILAVLLFRMRIEGRENIPTDKNCILMGNHISFFDPLTLGICARDREIRFMGKKELFEHKLLGPLLVRLHAFPVDRGNMDMGAIRTAMNVLKDGDTLGIFPEGTRSKHTYMMPILGGTSLLALKSGIAVVPVYIEGRYKLFRRVTVHIGSPIEMDDLLSGRKNKEACDELTRRVTASFALLSNGQSVPPAIPEKTEEPSKENAEK